MTKTQSLVAIPVIAATLLIGGALAGYATLASAQTATSTVNPQAALSSRHGGHHGHGHGRGVMGTVSAVNGTTITVMDTDGRPYTVNVGAATVHRVETGTLSDIHVGDTIGVQGEVSGTTVTAQTIMDDLKAWKPQNSAR